MKGWHSYWIGQHVRDLKYDLEMAKRCKGEARQDFLRYALSSIKLARKHNKGGSGVDYLAFASLVNLTKVLCRDAVLAGMKAEERKMCVDIAEWWKFDATLASEPHVLAFTIGLFVHYKRMVLLGKRPKLTSLINGEQGSIPRPLLEIISPYATYSVEWEDTVRALEKATNSLARWLPHYDQPEDYVIYGPAALTRAPGRLFYNLKYALNVP